MKTPLLEPEHGLPKYSSPIPLSPLSHDHSQEAPGASTRRGSDVTTKFWPTPTPREEVTHQEDRPLERYRKHVIALLVFYLPLLIVPWILICTLSVPGRDEKQFSEKPGTPRGRVKSQEAATRVAKVLSSIAGVAALPVLSALIARAAVSHCQRTKAGQKFNLAQTFALADRGWQDLAVVTRGGFFKSGSLFLRLAFLLIVIGVIQPPLQSLLVSYDLVAVRIWERMLSDDIIGVDPEPNDIAVLSRDLVVQQVASDLVTQHVRTSDPYIWLNYYQYQGKALTNGTFVAAHPHETSTGVLRYHAMRMNSTVQCERLELSKFPSNCDGKNSFTASFSRPRYMDLKVCVPGDLNASPWTLSRNKQSTLEEIFFRVSGISDTTYLANFTMHCTARTTRGYFELGNLGNDNQYGPLKDKWPSPEEMNKDFDDIAKNGVAPTESDTSRPHDYYANEIPVATGPLMMSAMAIFGNQSFFQIASNASNSTYPPAVQQICQTTGVPFSRLKHVIPSFCGYEDISYDYDDEGLVSMMTDWALDFNKTSFAENAFSTALLLTHKAVLTGSRAIRFNPGVMSLRPFVNTGAAVAISILLFLQLCGIFYLAWCIFRTPTWTETFDAMAIARMGAGLRDAGHVLPPIRALGDKELRDLASIDGLVGIDDAGRSTAINGEVDTFILGGTGLIDKKLH